MKDFRFLRLQTDEDKRKFLYASMGLVTFCFYLAVIFLRQPKYGVQRYRNPEEQYMLE